MSTVNLITAFSLGLLGSFHCLGMCGPIALALPVHAQKPLLRVISLIIYNLGRALTYAAFGLLFGLLGQALFLGGFQQGLSLLLGSLILISVLYTFLFRKGLFKWNGLNTFTIKLKSGFSALFQQRSVPAQFLIGLLNGLLPCGLVYIAIAGAINSGHYLQGAFFMFVFGLGTFPMMLSLSLFGQFVQLKYRNLMRRSVPVFVSLMAVLLILRGLNLGIPYVSPKISDAMSGANGVECCEKDHCTEIHCAHD